jgi:tRNA 2-selenouridine synthase
MTWRELSAERLFELKEPLVVDVRSPCEHAAEYIPGSVNIALLQDDERAVVGTIYATEGELVARREALRIVAPKIPSIVDEILSLKKPGQQLVVHCWRGGLRSETVASFLTVVGIDCWRLTGGYKAWRKCVMQDFAADKFQFVPVVLHGLTGVGKSDILRAFEKIGGQVLDLEELANHRGSVFGALGLDAQPTQKNFEAHLWLKLRSFDDRLVFLEGEGRKIGKVSLPDFLLAKIQSGRRILVTGIIEKRVERIVADYAPKLTEAVRSGALESMQLLQERLGARRTAEITEMGLSGSLSAAVEALLVEYYDPLYNRDLKRLEPYELTVSGDNVEQSAQGLLSWSESLKQAERV